MGSVNIHSGKVAQPAHRVKDKRLRRAFGILDTVRWLCSGMVKGLLPTPVEQGLTLWSMGGAAERQRATELCRDYCLVAF